MPVDLNPHQDYLIREFAEEYLEEHMSRRDMLRRVLLITGSIPATAALAFTLGCGTAKDDAARATSTASAAAKAPATATAAATATATGTPRAAATPGVPADDPALEAADIRFPGPAGELRGYLAKPKGAGTFPGLLIIHENRGLLDQVKDIARRYAKEGFVALAIDLVSRAGGTNLQDVAANTGFLGRSNPDDLVADCLAGIAHLKGLPTTQGKKLGVVGYCFGGGYTFEVAAASKDVAAAIPYYGTAQRPLEALARTSAAVLVNYGETDTRLTAQAPQVEERLKQSGRPYRIKIYQGAGHAFFNDTGASYNPEAAADSFKEALDWFRQHLA